MVKYIIQKMDMNIYEYWGNWENDQQMGQGREEWSGGSSYEGNYEYGNKSKHDTKILLFD